MDLSNLGVNDLEKYSTLGIKTLNKEVIVYMS
jgi:hypothetical protein